MWRTDQKPEHRMLVPDGNSAYWPAAIVSLVPTQVCAVSICNVRTWHDPEVGRRGETLRALSRLLRACASACGRSRPPRPFPTGARTAGLPDPEHATASRVGRAGKRRASRCILIGRRRRRTARPERPAALDIQSRPRKAMCRGLHRCQALASAVVHQGRRVRLVTVGEANLKCRSTRIAGRPS